jgi:beta-glucosidase
MRFAFLLFTLTAGQDIFLSRESAGAPPHPDAKSACASFTFSRKVELMHGFGQIDGYSRNSGCGYECGRKTFRWDNGPQGFGDHSPAGNSTQWPSALNIAATWDPKLAGEWGLAMGEEWWGKGTNILEGPGANVLRVPQNGRTFEYISGEDPVLGSMLMGPIIDNMQMNAMAIAKHYILNNQETDRSGVNELVDEKTIMELYAPPFEMAAKHKVAGYMCAYNRINHDWACENELTLKTMLKGYFNFTGFVVSDWGATHSDYEAFNAGLDIQMPDSSHFNEKNLKAALDAKKISMNQIDETCERIMRGWYGLPAEKRYPCDGGICINRNVSTPEHKELARKVSAQSTVLLKNDDNLLPLKKDKTLKIALIGSDASKPYTAGSGSGHVSDSNVAVSPMQAFERLGYQVTNSTGCEGGKDHRDAAASTAADADVAIVFVSATSGEGHDRADLKLSSVGGCKYAQEDLIEAVAAKQKKTIVVMVAPGPIRTDWRDKVAAIFCAFLPGEQYGNAITDLIFGDTMPQAKLPVTMPLGENDQGMTTHQWPGIPSKDFHGHKEVVYSEGQIVGYRWYDKHKVSPPFPFGHGLTYGGYKYSDLKVEGRTISFNVAGKGCDTPQVYISYPEATSATPAKVLRYFQKTCESTSISYTLTDRDISTWDVNKKQWVVVKGTFGLIVAPASQGGDVLEGHIIIS